MTCLTRTRFSRGAPGSVGWVGRRRTIGLGFEMGGKMSVDFVGWCMTVGAIVR